MKETVYQDQKSVPEKVCGSFFRLYEMNYYENKRQRSLHLLLFDAINSTTTQYQLPQKSSLFEGQD